MESNSVEVWDEGQKRDGRGRQIFNQAERERLLDRYDKSGQTQRAFAEREGINYTTFVGWLSRRRKGSGKGESAGKSPAFTEDSLKGQSTFPCFLSICHVFQEVIPLHSSLALPLLRDPNGTS